MKSRALHCFFIMALALVGACLARATQAEEISQAYKGLTINANLEQVKGKSLAEGVVLLVHSTLGHNRMEIIATAQERLAENGVSSLAINLSYSIDNRHGMYDCFEPHRHRFSDGIDEIIAWLNWLKARGAKRITLMGHSRGANLALAVAVEHDDPLIADVILLAPNTVGYDKYVAQYEARYGVKVADVLSRAKALIDEGRGDELMDGVDTQFCSKTQVSAAAFFDWYHRNSIWVNVASHLARITKPTLIVAGGKDELQPDIPEFVKPYVDGKQVRLIVIESAGHFFQDLHLEDALGKILAFIQEFK